MHSASDDQPQQPDSIASIACQASNIDVDKSCKCLLGLPTELRLQLYHHYVPYDTDLRSQKPPALVEVCRLLHDEVMPAWSRANKIHCDLDIRGYERLDMAFFYRYINQSFPLFELVPLVVVHLNKSKSRFWSSPGFIHRLFTKASFHIEPHGIIATFTYPCATLERYIRWVIHRKISH